MWVCVIMLWRSCPWCRTTRWPCTCTTTATSRTTGCQGWRRADGCRGVRTVAAYTLISRIDLPRESRYFREWKHASDGQCSVFCHLFWLHINHQWKEIHNKSDHYIYVNSLFNNKTVKNISCILWSYVENISLLFHKYINPQSHMHISMALLQTNRNKTCLN